jgi:lipid-A-disaccharide synthase
VPADVFLCAGESSGDLQASLLAGELLQRDPTLAVLAVGGDKLRAAGARVVIDSVADGWASMGHLRAYVKIPWLLAVLLALAERIMRERPRLLVCVDFGAFNLRLLEWLRFRGYRGAALYYFPPGVWIDSESQARKVARVARALTPFAHQADFYRRLGLPIDFFGHPLAGRIVSRTPRAPGKPPQIAVMPGSRDEELFYHLPVLTAAAMRLTRDRGARFLVIAASPEREAQLKAAWPEECGGADAVVGTPLVDAVAETDVAWVASGTAVMETALRGVPQIAYYKISDAQYAIVERRLPHIARGPITLPNLVTGRAVVPELLQHAFEPDSLIARTAGLLDDASIRGSQLKGIATFREMLGPPDALERIGAHVHALLRETKPS